MAVDLAAKYSAAVILDAACEVSWQADSWQVDEAGWVDLLCAPFAGRSPWVPARMVVEDLPHGVGYRTLVKTVCRLQGRIIDRMTVLGHVGRVLFVPPALWRKHYAGLKRGTGPNLVVEIAQDLGYEPPDTLHRIVKRDSAGRKPLGQAATARKVRTDYCAAWLIGRWYQQTVTAKGTFDIPGTQTPDGRTHG